MQIIIYTLLNYINCSIDQDTNYDIAKCLLLNIRKLRKLSLEDTALLCNVSPSTLKRFCKLIGFANYSTFKHLLENHDLPFDYDGFINNYNNTQYIDELYKGLQSIEEIPLENFLKLAHYIDKAEHIYVLGYGDFQYQAGYLQNVMLYHKKLFEIISQYEQLNNLSNLSEDDLVIVTSLTGGYAKKIKNKLSLLKCKKVLVTMDSTTSFEEYNPILNIKFNADANTNKYLIMRIYEKIISSYYFYKTGQILNCKK